MVGKKFLAPVNFVTIFTDEVLFTKEETSFSKYQPLLPYCVRIWLNTATTAAAICMSFLLILASSTPIGVLSSHLLEEGNL